MDPATGDKKFQMSKKDDYQLKNEVQKNSRGRYKIERDSNWDPIGDHYVGSRHGGLKKTSGQKRTITSSKKSPKNFC